MSIMENSGSKDGLLISECSSGSSASKGELLKPCTRNPSGMVICFNKHLQELFKTLLASRFKKYFIVFTKRPQGNHATLTQDRKPSTTSADMSTKAMAKFLRKYNKIQGLMNHKKYKAELQSVQLENLTSPCQCELMAFLINLKERKNKTIQGLLDECKLQIGDGRCSLSMVLSNSRVLDVELTCSVCLETLFDPVSLACSHMFCYMCACSAGSVSTVDGIKSAESKSKCPLCRKEGVFRDAVRMSQLSSLLKRKFPEYWEERRQKERQTRLKEAKEYWEFQCRAFVGIS